LLDHNATIFGRFGTARGSFEEFYAQTLFQEHDPSAERRLLDAEGSSSARETLRIGGCYSISELSYLYRHSGITPQ
jgi:hypothetical protein